MVTTFMILEEIYMANAVCVHCKHEFSYDLSANFIIFCPKCRKQTFMECEYGYGPVTPCDIRLGNEKIAAVTTENYVYYYKSERFGIDKRLEKEYLEALQEAAKLTAKLLEEEK